MVIVPALTGVTTPLAFTVAIELLLLLHTPPLVALLNVTVLPIQAVLLLAVMAATVIADATVTVVPALVVLPPQLVTVTV